MELGLKQALSPAWFRAGLIAAVLGAILGVSEAIFLILWGVSTTEETAVVLVLAGYAVYAVTWALAAWVWSVLVSPHFRRPRYHPQVTVIAVLGAVYLTLAVMSVGYPGQYPHLLVLTVPIGIATYFVLRPIVARLAFLGSVHSCLRLLAVALAISIWVLVLRHGIHRAALLSLFSPIVVLGCVVVSKAIRATSGRALLVVLANALAVGTLVLLPARKLTSPTASGSGPNVVLITIDTLRADHLGVYGYGNALTPNIDRLAREGSVLLETVSPMPWTGPSHTSILTGLYPRTHGVLANGVRLNPRAVTLPDTLAERGYATAAFVSGYTLADKVCGLASHFDRYDDNFGAHRWLPDALGKLRLLNAFRLSFSNTLSIASRNERRAGETTDAAIQWLDRQSHRPFFLWVHYFDPHSPYHPPPPYDNLHDRQRPILTDGRWYLIDAAEREAVVENQAGVRHVVAMYDGEISYTDAEIERLRTAVERATRQKDTLIVLTADHGESLGEHNYYFDHDDLYDVNLHVPLIFHFPGHLPSGRKISGQTRLIDIAPTILDVLEIGLPSAFDGSTLVPLMFERPTDAPRPAFATLPQEDRKVGRRLSAVRYNGYKLISGPGWWFGGSRFPPVYELYDLRSDPQELNNIAAQAPPALAELRVMIEQSADKKHTVDPALSPETLERLRSLGYAQ